MYIVFSLRAGPAGRAAGTISVRIRADASAVLLRSLSQISHKFYTSRIASLFSFLIYLQ